MGNRNLKPSLRAVVAAALASDTLAADQSHQTGGVDMSACNNAMFAGSMGAFGSGGSATVELEQATKSDFSDAKAVDGRTPVDVVEGKPLQVNVSAGELDINSGFRYVRAVVKTVGGSLKGGLLAYAFDARHDPMAPLEGTVIDG